MIESSDGGQPIPGRCAWLPVHTHIVDARIHSCAQRKPLNEPRYVVPVPENEEQMLGGNNG